MNAACYLAGKVFLWNTWAWIKPPTSTLRQARCPSRPLTAALTVPPALCGRLCSGAVWAGWCWVRYLLLPYMAVCVAYITLQRGGWWMTSSSNTHSHVLNIHSHLCVVFKETLQGRLSRPWTGSVCHTDAASTRGGSKNQPFIVESGLSLEKVLAAEPCQVGRVVLVGSWTRHSDLCKRKDNVVMQLACSC